MNVIVESRIVGMFFGYAPGVIHRLHDGSEWVQVGNIKEYVYRERPACWVVWDRDRHWIGVDGTSGVAEVRRYTGKLWAGAGAY
jgi:hypothetical protein